MAKVYASEREMLDELMGKSLVAEKPRRAYPGDEKAAAIYHEMLATESFDTTAEVLFMLVREAITKFPNKRRILYLDIDGHREDDGSFDHDAFEIQNQYVCGFLGKWLHEAHMTLVCWTNDKATNDISQSVEIRPS